LIRAAEEPMTMRVASAPAQAISAERAAGFVRSGMWLDYGTSLCQPDVFDNALGARIHEVTNVKIRHCLTMRPRAVLDADPEGHHVHGFSLHYSGYDRRKHDDGRCNYIPVNLGEIPDYYRRFIDPVDIVILKTCPIVHTPYWRPNPPLAPSIYTLRLIVTCDRWMERCYHSRHPRIIYG